LLATRRIERRPILTGGIDHGYHVVKIAGVLADAADR
jgi:hypothetical protein